MVMTIILCANFQLSQSLLIFKSVHLNMFKSNPAFTVLLEKNEHLNWSVRLKKNKKTHPKTTTTHYQRTPEYAIQTHDKNKLMLLGGKWVKRGNLWTKGSVSKRQLYLMRKFLTCICVFTRVFENELFRFIPMYSWFIYNFAVYPPSIYPNSAHIFSIFMSQVSSLHSKSYSNLLEINDGKICRFDAR